MKFFLSPARSHKSIVYENINFFFQKTTHDKKTNSASKFIGTNSRHFVFQQRKVLLEYFFKYNSNNMLFFCGLPGKNFFRLRFSGNKSIIFFGLINVANVNVHVGTHICITLTFLTGRLSCTFVPKVAVYLLVCLLFLPFIN